MATRRSRLQVKPNFAPKAKKPGVSKERVADADTASQSVVEAVGTSSSASQDVTTENSSPQDTPIASTSKSPKLPTDNIKLSSQKGDADNGPSEACSSDGDKNLIETTAPEQSKKAATAAPTGRRGRLKWNVCVGKKSAANPANSTGEATETTDDTDGKANTDTKEANDVTPAESYSEERAAEKTSAIPQAETPECNIVSKPAESEKEAQTPPDTHPTDQSKEATVETTTKKVATPVRRSRFPKARPNLSDISRGRARHLSVSENDREEGLRSPPPVSRVTHISSSAEEPKSGDTTVTPLSTMSAEENVAPSPSVSGTSQPQNQSDSGGGASKRTRRLIVKMTDPVDKSKLTMKDLIYMNPTANPMKASPRMRRKQPDSSLRVSESSTMDPEPPASPPPPAPEDEVRDGSGSQEAVPVPQVTIGPDGNIVLNEQSLVIENSPTKSLPGSTEVIDETDIFGSGDGLYPRRTRTKAWSTKETMKFYVALSMVGTDFSLMSTLFPKRSRTELKRKFKKEDRLHREMIEKALKKVSGFNMALLHEHSSSSEDEEQQKKETVRKQGRKRARKNSQGPGQEGQGEGSTATHGSPKGKKKPRSKGKKSGSRYYDKSSEEENNAIEEPGPDDEICIVESLTKVPTRAGRRPKTTKTAKRRREESPVKSPVTSPHPIHSLLSPRPLTLGSPRLQSPPPPIIMSPGAPGTPGGQFVPLTQLSSPVNVNHIQPGQFVFVPAGGSAGVSDSTKQPQMMHVFMVSPPGVGSPRLPGNLIVGPQGLASQTSDTVTQTASASATLSSLATTAAQEENILSRQETQVETIEIQDSEQGTGEGTLLPNAEVITRRTQNGAIEIIIDPKLDQDGHEGQVIDVTFEHPEQVVMTTEVHTPAVANEEMVSGT